MQIDTKEVINRAQGCWSYILESIGIPPEFLVNKHGPCPVCGGKDRFRFDDKEGRGTCFCNQCGPGDGVDLLMKYTGWSFPEVIEHITRVLRLNIDIRMGKPTHIAQVISHTPITEQLENRQRELAEKQQKANKNKLNSCWRAALPISKGDPVDSYLSARGICLSKFPSCLRYHPRLHYYEAGELKGYFPAMLASLTDENGIGVTIHRTYLGDRCKADLESPKKFMSSARELRGSSIKLFEPVNKRIAIAEGIETALSFGLLHDVPAWSTCTAGGMEKVDIPSSVSTVIIAIDNDDNGRGREAGEKLAERLRKEGQEVEIVEPPEGAKDFNDVLVRNGK